jgi:hypothetical protein
VTKLQTALALSPEQVAALPPPTLRIRQLEQENAKLMRENEELRRQLHMQTRRPSLMTDPHFDMARRGSFQSSMSSDYPDRELKRRRVSQNVDGVYLVGFFSLSYCPVGDTAPALALLSPSAIFFFYSHEGNYRAPARLQAHRRWKPPLARPTFRRRHHRHHSRTTGTWRPQITPRHIRAQV